MENEETNTTAPWPTVQYVVRVYELYVGPKLIDCALATVRRDAHVNVLRPLGENYELYFPTEKNMCVLGYIWKELVISAKRNPLRPK